MMGGVNGRLDLPETAQSPLSTGSTGSTGSDVS
jgi:hypothetical protein